MAFLNKKTFPEFKNEALVRGIEVQLCCTSRRKIKKDGLLDV